VPDLGGRSEGLVSRLLITPGQVLMFFLVAFPAAVAIYIGFTEWTPTSGKDWWQAYHFWHWFSGYWEALGGASSGAFWHAVWITILITVVAVGIEFLLGFALALLFLREFRGRGFLTLFFLLPMMVVPAVSGFIFFMLFQVDGPVNQALTAILPGSVHIHWLDDPNLTKWSVMTVDIWQWTPLMFLILLSGLVALPEDQMNQARLLGASFWHQLRYLILPMLKPIILIALIIRGVEVFKLFDSAFILTNGGNLGGNAASTVSIYLYKQVIVNARWGYASAVAIIVLIFVSTAGVFAVRPIEQAQEETFEELVGAEAPPVQEQAIEQAIEVEATV
jgi:multiple sugar transport system permease protein